MDVNTSAEFYSTQNSNDKDDLATNLAEPGTSESEGNEDEIDVTEYHKKLKERLLSLRATMQDLKKQMKEEKDNWRKEMDFVKFHTKSVTSVPSDTSLDDSSQSYLTGYEHYSQNKRFEDAINQAHKESRANLQRQIAISNYKRRLLEVENMCNMELLRVKQNVQFLQPLQLMASEWNCNKDVSHNESGDAPCVKANSSLTSITTSGSEDTKSKEVSMPLEMISNKLYNDMNDMFSKLSAQCNESMPQLSCGNWPNENQKTQSRSAVWYNECVPTQNN